MKNLDIPNTNEVIKECKALLKADKVKPLSQLLHEHPAMNELNLDSYSFDPVSVKALAQVLTDNHTITTLSIARAGITDDDITTLSSALVTNDTLEYISVPFNPISGEGVKQLERVLVHNIHIKGINICSSLKYDRYEIQDKRVFYSSSTRMTLSSKNMVEGDYKNHLVQREMISDKAGSVTKQLIDKYGAKTIKNLLEMYKSINKESYNKSIEEALGSIDPFKAMEHLMGLNSEHHRNIELE